MVDVTKTGTISVLVNVNQQSTTVTGTVSVVAARQQVTATGSISVEVTGATVNVGPNITVDAGERVTITAQTEIPAAGTTITGRSWTLAGQVIGNSRTVAFNAPITRDGTTVIPQYRVTDNNGATTPPASIAVTVRPATLRTGGGRPIVKKTGPA